MAPTRTVRTKIPAKGTTKGTSHSGKRTPTTGTRTSKSSKPTPVSAKTTKQQKTKRSTNLSQPKKKRTYTAEQLGVPLLNGIRPVGVTKPKGKKKGKVFIDDEEQMMTILKIVEAEAEGHLEGKVAKQRKLEEVREARRVEAEKREEKRHGKLDQAKAEIRSQRKVKGKKKVADGETNSSGKKEQQIKAAVSAGVPRKRVSFA